MHETTILLIDDDPLTLETLRSILEPRGYRVITALDGASGIKTATRELPDAILLDVEMPGLSGWETCRLLKGTRATRTIPIIFCTCREGSRNLISGMQVGADGYVTKPFESKTLIDQLTKLLRRSAAGSSESPTT